MYNIRFKTYFRTIIVSIFVDLPKKFVKIILFFYRVKYIQKSWNKYQNLNSI